MGNESGIPFSITLEQLPTATQEHLWNRMMACTGLLTQKGVVVWNRQHAADVTQGYSDSG